MQQQDAVQNSKLKTAKKGMWWVLGTVTAVPLTKWVESQLDYSFFSPAISVLWSWIQALGSWLSMAVSLPLWLLIAIMAWGLLMVGAVVWVMVYADGKLKVADRELKEADAKLRALSPTEAQLKSTQAELESHKVELKAAQEKIADLQDPKLPPLTQDQDRVLAAIAHFDNADRKCRTKELPEITEMELLQTDGAVDVLLNRKLIQLFYPSSGKYATLTARGRAHYLSPDFMPPFLPFLPAFAPERKPYGRI